MTAVGSVRVVSKRKGGTCAIAGESVIDVDRKHPVLGNRHVLANHNDRAQRQRVIELNREDIQIDKNQGGPISQEINRLARRVLSGERLALRCWCAPEDCHADTIRSEILLVVDELMKRFKCTKVSSACVQASAPELTQQLPLL